MLLILILCLLYIFCIGLCYSVIKRLYGEAEGDLYRSVLWPIVTLWWVGYLIYRGGRRAGDEILDRLTEGYIRRNKEVLDRKYIDALVRKYNDNLLPRTSTQLPDAVDKKYEVASLPVPSEEERIRNKQ